MARFATYTRNTGINPKDKITYSGLIEASELEDALRYETVTSTIEDLGLFFAGNYFSTDGINYSLASIDGRITALENQVESDPVFALWDRSAGISITESQISDLKTYLTSYTETDPVFTGHTVYNISNGTGYLKNDGLGNWTYDVPVTTETDPVFTSHTTYNISNATTAGFLRNDNGTWSYDTNTYLTSYTESDPVFTNHIVSSIVEGNGALTRTSNVWSYESYQKTSEKGQANGYVPLDTNTKIDPLFLPDSITGQLTYKGAWDASTGAYPVTAVTGDMYAIEVAGTINTVLHNVGDWIIYNGSTWDHIQNGVLVTSVAGKTGAVTIGVNDLSDATISTPSSGQILKYNGTNWVNAAEYSYTPPAGTVVDANYAHITVTSTSVSDGTTTFNKYTAPAGTVVDSDYSHITVTASSVSDGTTTFNKYSLPSDVVQDSNYAHITVTSTSVSDGTTTFDKYTAPAGTVVDSDYSHITVTSTSVSDGTTTFNKYTAPAGTVVDSDYSHITVTESSVSDGTTTFNKYSLPTASSTVLGGVKIGYTNTGKNYKVELDANNAMYVNVPWTDTNTDTNTTYSISAETLTGGANLRLTDSGAGTDDIAIKGSGATTVTRTDANTITISSTDTNTDTNYYLNGITRTAGTNKLVFSVSGATNQEYTFGANAFTDTAIPTGALASLNSVTDAQIDANSVGASELKVSGNGLTGQVLTSDADGTFSWTTLNYYTHPDYSETDINTTGAQVIDTMTIVNGHVNAFTYRNLTLANLGYTGATDAEKNVQSDWNATEGDALILNKPTIPSAYTHPDYTETDIDTSGAQVIDTMTIVNGHVNGHTTRDLTPADIGAATSNHTHDYSSVYAPLVHTHSYLPLVGGSITGTTDSTSYTTGALTIAGGLGVAKNIVCNADIVAYSSSDRNLKDNIKPIENALLKVNSIGGYEFDWNDKQSSRSGHDVGVIAQEIEKVLPEVVVTRDSGYKAVDYEKIVPLLIEAIKDLSNQVEELKNVST